MKLIPAILFLATALPVLAADPYAAWPSVQKVAVSGAGLVRVELPASTIGASQPHLDDLRLVSADGIETPCLVEWPHPENSWSFLTPEVHITLAGQTTVLEFSAEAFQPVRAVELLTSASAFIKAASVEGSNDGERWEPVASNELVFRQTDKTERLRLPVPRGTWKRLRVVIDDRRWGPVPFTGVRLELEKSAQPTVPLPVVVQKRVERGGRSRLTLSLGGANRWVAWLKLRVSDPLFSRQVYVSANDRTIGSERLYQLDLDGHQASSLTLPVRAQVTTAEVEVEIDNGDSPPLKIEGVEAAVYPVSLTFHAKAAGEWRLFTGNAAAPAPVYDVAALGDELRAASSATASVGELSPNPGFDSKAALPETGAPGAAIDLKNWAFRQPVTTTQRGVMQVELGLEALAHSRPGFGDVRLVQGGRQVPYVMQPIASHQGVAVPFAVARDPKRPAVSRWELKLPVKGMPFTSLNLTSPTPLFSRYFELVEPVRDRYGNASKSVVATASWNHRPADVMPLSMLLSLPATGDTLYLETDNGDNSPVELGEITVYHPVVRLLFKTLDAAPVHLWYGNPAAYAPRYDLGLVEAELKKAAPLTAALGPEEPMKPPGTGSREESSQGGLLLWATLALVVGGLLWLVAQWLPENKTPA